MYGTLEDDERVELLARIDALEERLARVEKWANGEQDLMEMMVARMVTFAQAVRDLRKRLYGPLN